LARDRKLATAHGAAARFSVNVIWPWLVRTATSVVPVRGGLVVAGTVTGLAALPPFFQVHG
jgi:hypothetical protein